MRGADTVEAALDRIVTGARTADMESETLDFKTDGRSRNDTPYSLAEAAACFANARGGSIVVGVRDRASGPEALVGTSLDAQRTQRRIFELTEPRLVVSCDPATRLGRSLLVITVPPSPDVHSVGGRTTERVGTACEPMSTSRIATVVADRRGDDWSAEDSGIAVTEVDDVAIAQARATAMRAGGSRAVVSRRSSDLAVLRAMGVVTSTQTLTNAGALLLTARLERAEDLAYSFRRTPAGALVTNEHMRAPLLSSVLRVFDLIDARLERTPVNLPRGQQVLIADLPDAAVRESVINAIMHRDYRRPTPVVVEHSPTSLVVTSPGPFVSGVTAQNVLTTSSRTRNGALANAIRVLGLAESAGTGVDRMYAEMSRVGHQPPNFEADFEQVRVTLLGGAPNAHLARFVASLPEDEAGDTDTMLVLLTLLSHRTVNAETMSDLVQKSVTETQAVLERLGSESVQLIERTRQTARDRLPTYRLREHAVAELRPALSYRRRSVDEYDRKVIGVVRETGEINSRLVKLTLDLDTTAASRLLADLVDRGILVKTSHAQRGPGVTYGPGPRFPRRSFRKSTATVGKG